MSNETTISRRKFAAAAASMGIMSIAGCSDNGGESTPTTNPSSDTPTTTSNETDTQTEGTTTDNGSNPTETTDDIPTASSEPDDKVSDGLIETLADYEYVAKRPDEFVGTEIRCDGLGGDLRYYNEYGEDYSAFRALFEEGTRPFMLKTDEDFMNSERIKFSGTIEKIDDLQDTPVIYVEDVTIETWRNN